MLSMGAIRDAYVPLPAPGAPRNMILRLGAALAAELNMARCISITLTMHLTAGA